MNRVHVASLAWLLAVGAGRNASAGAGPPLVTDEPGTPGDGNWEINVATEYERRADETVAALPLLDIQLRSG